MLILIPACQIASKLNESQRERTFDVLYKDSRALACTASFNETMRLASQGMVSAVANKHGYLRYLVAEISVHVIRRALRDVRLPQFNTHAISHLKQDPGVRRWVPRPDMAHCGIPGSSRSVFMPCKPKTPALVAAG